VVAVAVAAVIVIVIVVVVLPATHCRHSHQKCRHRQHLLCPPSAAASAKDTSANATATTALEEDNRWRFNIFWVSTVAAAAIY
jgi:hypothetical protein